MATPEKILLDSGISPEAIASMTLAQRRLAAQRAVDNFNEQRRVGEGSDIPTGGIVPPNYNPSPMPVETAPYDMELPPTSINDMRYIGDDAYQIGGQVDESQYSNKPQGGSALGGRAAPLPDGWSEEAYYADSPVAAKKRRDYQQSLQRNYRKAANQAARADRLAKQERQKFQADLRGLNGPEAQKAAREIWRDRRNDDDDLRRGQANPGIRGMDMKSGIRSFQQARGISTGSKPKTTSGNAETTRDAYQSDPMVPRITLPAETGSYAPTPTPTSGLPMMSSNRPTAPQMMGGMKSSVERKKQGLLG